MTFQLVKKTKSAEQLAAEQLAAENRAATLASLAAPWTVKRLDAADGAELFRIPFCGELIHSDDMPVRNAARARLLRSRRAMSERGYLPVPIFSADAEDKAAGKGTRVDGWQKIYAVRDDVRAGVELMLEYASTGLLAGAGETPLAPIDVDILDPALADQIQKLAVESFGSTPLVRIGRAPKTMLIFRSAAGLGKMQTRAVFLPDGAGAYDVTGEAQKVEVLGRGNQFVASGVHPKTMRPYSWPDQTPLDVAAADLPLVTEAHLKRFLDAAETMLRAAGGRTKAELTPRSEHAPSPAPAAVPGDLNAYEQYAAENRPAARMSDSDLARDALRFINSDDYVTWIKVTGALHGACLDGDLPDAREIAEEWSRNYPKFDQEEFDTKWASFLGVRAGFGTIVFMAEQAGWVNPKRRTAEESRQAARRGALEEFGAEAGEENIESKYAGEVVWNGERGAWIDLADRGRKGGLRESVIYDKTDPGAAAQDAEAALLRDQAERPKALEKHLYEYGSDLVRVDIRRLAGGGGVTAALTAVTRPALIGRLGAVTTFRPKMSDDISADDAAEIIEQQKKARAKESKGNTNGKDADEPRFEVPQPIAVPSGVADIILASRGIRGFTRVNGVRTCPTLRPDGSILSEDGFDAATGVLLVSGVTLPPMPSDPTLEDAKSALKTLAELFAETAFEPGSEKVGLAVSLSSCLSAVARPMVDFVPIHAASAPTRGSGKSFAHEIVSRIANGRHAVVMVGKNAEEFEKELRGLLLKGYSPIVIDNANGNFENNLVAQIASQSELLIRKMNTNDVDEVPNQTLILINGNSLRLADDLTRRSLMTIIDRGVSRPELHQFKKDPRADIIANRGKYVAAALVALRGFILAKARGEAESKTPRLAGFVQWSDLIRSCLIWAGYADPCESMERIQEDDPAMLARAEIFSAWSERFGTAPVTVHELIAGASPPPSTFQVNRGETTDDTKNRALAETQQVVAAAALEDALRSGIPGQGGQRDLNPRTIGNWCRDNRDRIAADFKMVKVNRQSRSKRLAEQWKIIRSAAIEDASENAATGDNVVSFNEAIVSKKALF